MSQFHDWEDLRPELHDGDDEAIERERARTEAWVGAFHLAEERKRLGLTQRQVAELMGVSPGRVSQIENGDLDVNEVATLSRYAMAGRTRLRDPRRTLESLAPHHDRPTPDRRCRRRASR
ncbi:transcriptional regulator [Paractinoplanes hotanensis]|uniref:Helix-turn-helix domain-containing protein n=1 Tax=Paractinoplanes hotanensis TaxID=2906497 RepID=A0ABT0XZN9_9ACTN|nr:transcriptional regulator [Actinoplanes hotanensis]MCM4079253.1 helix-turn-helix domain-containing protein [Actinoplanes hotanensis]